MCEASVSRYLTLFHTTGDVTPRKHSSGPDKMLNELEQFTVLQTLIHRPTSYLSEVQDDLFDATGTWASASTICRTIKEQGFTRKKVQLMRGLQRIRSEVKRAEFMAEISHVNLECENV